MTDRSLALRRRVKRGLDVTAAASALVVLSPVFAAVSLWIVVTEGRPVLFVQERVGRDGRTFRMLKFRSMVHDAVTVGLTSGLIDEDDPTALVENDPRIHPCGRFLRRTGLDELPQVVNVLRGEMSLVGPRPDVPEQVVLYSEPDRRRLAVTPGITGWAQVNGRAELPWPERFRLDAWYVDNWSLRLDAVILCRTVAALRREDPVPVPDEFTKQRRRVSRRD